LRPKPGCIAAGCGLESKLFSIQRFISEIALANQGWLKRGRGENLCLSDLYLINRVLKKPCFSKTTSKIIGVFT
jgi:hypothetical protein